MSKVIVEIKRFYSEDYKKEVNGLYVAGELFDWAIDLESLISHCANPSLIKSVKGDISRHFVTSFSEAMGRNMTMQQISEAIEKGYIEI